MNKIQRRNRERILSILGAILLSLLGAIPMAIDGDATAFIFLTFISLCMVLDTIFNK